MNQDEERQMRGEECVATDGDGGDEGDHRVEIAEKKETARNPRKEASRHSRRQQILPKKQNENPKPAAERGGWKWRNGGDDGV